MKLKKTKNILVCPLEWGLGHAGRMIAVAAKLRDMNNKIFIGAGKEHLLLFKNEIPDLSLIEFPGFKPAYSRFLPQYMVLFLKTPLLIYHSIREHYKLKIIIQHYNIDIVISDNRFGLWNRNVKTAYFTHMLRIPFPKGFKRLEAAGIFLHRIIIKKYSLCFIPDLPGKTNLTGRMTHDLRLPENAIYTGILSRFTLAPALQTRNNYNFPHNTVILSGPEPQRTLLKKKLTNILTDKQVPSIFLEGRPDKEIKFKREGNIISYNHLPASEMKEMIIYSESIICRSGYSTIMELISLKCTALLVPTPGQTEQEYLASYLSQKGWFRATGQKALKPCTKLPHCKASLWPDEIIEKSGTLLENALGELLRE